MRYSTLLVVALDSRGATQKFVGLPGGPIARRDLSLTTPLDGERFYREHRLATAVRKAESFEIEDITAT